jgi:hypothetical protein
VKKKEKEMLQEMKGRIQGKGEGEKTKAADGPM